MIKLAHLFDDRLALVSDIHGNSLALKAAISKIKESNVSNVLIMGDLLTYGCSPNSVVEQLIDLSAERNCYFLKGNHDQFYFDINAGAQPFTYEVPSFIRESVLWTQENSRYNLYNEFKWFENLIVHNCYFAHANPFTYGNWRYMNHKDDYIDAAKRLNEKGCRTAFFGHTHRTRVGICKSNDNFKNILVDMLPKTTKRYKVDLRDGDDIYISVVGSIGQPRGAPASISFLTPETHGFDIDIIELDFDIEAHIKQIQKSNMTQATKDKLISYFIKVEK
tara:strand:- start:409 stop:1242 length:834 start_codon:yes stop_codon:yes gene_type:complete